MKASSVGQGAGSDGKMSVDTCKYNELLKRVDENIAFSKKVKARVQDVQKQCTGLRTELNGAKDKLEECSKNLKDRDAEIVNKEMKIQELTETKEKAENELRDASSKVAFAVERMQELVGMVSSITGETFVDGGFDAMVEFLNQNLQSANERINAWKDQSKVVVEKDNETHESIESNEEAENELENSKFGTSDATKLMKNFVDVIRLITGCKDKDPQKTGTIIDFIHKNIDAADKLIQEWRGQKISEEEGMGLLTTKELVGQEAGSPNMMISATKKALKRFASMVSSITGEPVAGDDFDVIKNFIHKNIDAAETQIKTWKSNGKNNKEADSNAELHSGSYAKTSSQSQTKSYANTPKRTSEDNARRSGLRSSMKKNSNTQISSSVKNSVKPANLTNVIAIDEESDKEDHGSDADVSKKKEI